MSGAHSHRAVCWWVPSSTVATGHCILIKLDKGLNVCYWNNGIVYMTQELFSGFQSMKQFRVSAFTLREPWIRHRPRRAVDSKPHTLKP